MNIKHGAAVASAVAFLFAAGCGDDGSGDESTGEGSQASTVKCQGINDCAGMSECAGPDGANDCQGQNECAGMGWVSVDSEQECVDQGGEVIS